MRIGWGRSSGGACDRRRPPRARGGWRHDITVAGTAHHLGFLQAAVAVDPDAHDHGITALAHFLDIGEQGLQVGLDDPRVPLVAITAPDERPPTLLGLEAEAIGTGHAIGVEPEFLAWWRFVGGLVGDGFRFGFRHVDFLHFRRRLFDLRRRGRWWRRRLNERNLLDCRRRRRIGGAHAAKEQIETSTDDSHGGCRPNRGAKATPETVVAVVIQILAWFHHLTSFCVTRPICVMPMRPQVSRTSTTSWYCTVESPLITTGRPGSAAYRLVRRASSSCMVTG